MKDSKEYYSDISDEYMTNNAFLNRYHQNRFDTFNSLVPVNAKRILDFGCGSAENVVHLIRRGHDVTGIDPVVEMVELGKAHVLAAGLEPDRIQLGDVNKLSTYEIGAFDVVAALNVLPYLTEAEEEFFYSQAKRITTDDGYIVVSHTNELVDLITFNRYTVEFWRDKILPNLTDSTEVQQELLEIFSSHLSHPEKPAVDAGLRKQSERDYLKKRRINPMVYPDTLREKYGLIVENVAFTHFYPMPPQFMETSEQYKYLVFHFEEVMKGNPLQYIFASIMMLCLRKLAK